MLAGAGWPRRRTRRALDGLDRTTAAGAIPELRPRFSHARSHSPCFTEAAPSDTADDRRVPVPAGRLAAIRGRGQRRPYPGTGAVGIAGLLRCCRCGAHLRLHRRRQPADGLRIWVWRLELQLQALAVTLSEFDSPYHPFSNDRRLLRLQSPGSSRRSATLQPTGADKQASSATGSFPGLHIRTTAGDTTASLPCLRRLPP